MTHALIDKLRPARWPHIMRRGFGMIVPPRLDSYERFRSLFAERSGLELGGPSRFFQSRGLFPIYCAAARIDNCNFGRETIWEGSVGARHDFHYDPRRAPGFKRGEALAERPGVLPRLSVESGYRRLDDRGS